MSTYAEQLSTVQAAITQILTNGQSVGHSESNLTRANLADLQSREKWLIGMVERESRGTSAIRVRGMTPTS